MFFHIIYLSSVISGVKCNEQGAVFQVIKLGLIGKAEEKFIWILQKTVDRIVGQYKIINKAVTKKMELKILVLAKGDYK